MAKPGRVPPKAVEMIRQADALLRKIRTETPVDYNDTPDKRNAVREQLQQADDLLEGTIRIVYADSGADLPLFFSMLGPVRLLLNNVGSDLTGGRLPRSKNDPTGLPEADPSYVGDREMAEDARQLRK